MEDDGKEGGEVEEDGGVYREDEARLATLVIHMARSGAELDQYAEGVLVL